MVLETVLKYIDALNSFDVKFEGAEALVVPYEGIKKIDTNDIKSLIKSKKTKKLDNKRKKLLKEITQILINNKLNFKIIFEKDPILKFELDKYIVITEDTIKIFGFKSKTEHPLDIIYDKLAEMADCYFYKPVR